MRPHVIVPKHISVTSKSDEPNRFFFSVVVGAMAAVLVVRIGVYRTVEAVFPHTRVPNTEMRDGANGAWNANRFISIWMPTWRKLKNYLKYNPVVYPVLIGFICSYAQ